MKGYVANTYDGAVVLDSKSANDPTKTGKPTRQALWDRVRFYALSKKRQTEALAAQLAEITALKMRIETYEARPEFAALRAEQSALSADRAAIDAILAGDLSPAAHAFQSPAGQAAARAIAATVDRTLACLGISSGMNQAP